MTQIETLLNVLAFLLGGVGLLLPTIDYTLLKNRRKRISPYATIATLIISLILISYLSNLTYVGSKYIVYGGSLRIDFYGSFFAFVATLGALLVSIASLGEAYSWTTAPSYYSLILLALLGAYYLIFVNDLVLLLTAWTLIAVVSYVLAGVKKDESSIEGAAKYALMGVAASALMLFAIAIVYGISGTTSLEASSLTLSKGYTPLLLAGVLLFTAAFGFKIGVVPFHGWLPDVYGGIHPTLVSYLAGVVKIAGIALLLRIIYPLAPLLGERWLILFALLSIATMTFGNVVALIQRNVQRMMAYSSIAHVGYILVGLASATSVAGSRLGLEGIALHVTSYMLAKVGMFTLLAYMVRKGISPNLDDMKGMGRHMPVTSASMTILLLNLMGVPPLLGFWSKLYIFISVVDIVPWLTLIAILNSGVSVGYYAQIIRYVYFEGSNKTMKESIRDPEAFIVVVATILTVIMGLGPALLLAPTLEL
ncbi:MAG: NADH-quinone oxidoreductase subunit N [Candidatus Geothermarchaeales archaeon]